MNHIVCFDVFGNRGRVIFTDGEAVMGDEDPITGSLPVFPPLGIGIQDGT